MTKATMNVNELKHLRQSLRDFDSPNTLVLSHAL